MASTHDSSRAFASLRVVLAVAGLLTACEGGFVDPFVPGGGEARPRCAELGARLSIEPSRASVGAGQLLALQARGGTGQYRFSMLDAPSGGTVDATRGLYVAGVTVGEGAEDIILLEDRGCTGEATASVEVIAAPAIRPSRVELERGDAVAFTGSGGSGEYTFSLVSSESGASVEADGRYRAGTSLGRDIVRLRDDVLGASADAVVEVVVDGSLRLSPSRWVIPLDAEITLPIEGGSGEYSVEGGGDRVAATGVSLTALRAGRAELSVRDVHTDRVLAVPVTVAGRHVVSRDIPPDRSDRHQVAGGVFDLTGDGRPDAVVGLPRASVGAFRSGGVYVYAGNGTGLDLEPAIILGGERRGDEFGNAVEVRDLDGDGFADLVVGAPLASPTTNSNGSVEVYRGGPRGLSEQPATRFFGFAASDSFGHSIAICDFNGDGRLDLAVGAPRAEDRDRSPRINDHGGVFVFLAYSGGRFVSAPDQRLYGEMPADGVFANMRLGESMAAGDFDGDGLCDLAVYAPRPHPDRNNWGVVALYRGRAPGESRGGLEPTPSIIWTPTDEASSSGRFGETLAMADMDGDGRADLLVGQREYSGAEGRNTGALWLFRGRTLTGPASGTTEPAADAWWSAEGVGRDDLAGHRVAFADVDGDGRPDVVSGESRAGVEEVEASRPGVVRVFRGRGEGPAAEPWRVYTVDEPDARFGLGLGILEGLTGEGASPLMVFAPYASQEPGDERGALFLQPASGQAPTRLMVPAEATGQTVGAAVALVDLDGDAHPEVVVGAPGAIGETRAFDRGVVRIHRGTADGSEAEAIQVIDDLPFRTGGDQLGLSVAAAGDFAGEGREYLAVIARQTNRPSEFDEASFDVDPACAGSRSNAGALYLFRSRADGRVEAAPSFIVFGPYTSGRLHSVVGGGDVDGDGLPDLIVGGREWSENGSGSGGFMVVRGRPRPGDGRVAVLCPDLVVDGPSGSRLGTAVAMIGDLGEGADDCDAFAVGAPEMGGEESSQGAVHVYSGFGAACARETPARIVFVSGERAARAGQALAGGVDVDGDGGADLAIGMPRYRGSDGEVGRVWVLRASAVLARAWDSGPHRLTQGEGGFRASIDGLASGERSGSALALVARPGQPALLLSGGPLGDSSGRALTGGVVAYEVGASGIAPARWLQMSGESVGRGELGDALAAAWRGTRLYLAAGAPRSRVDALDDGSSYSAGVSP